MNWGKSIWWVVKNRPTGFLFKKKFGIPYAIDVGYIVAQATLYDCYWSVEPKPKGLRGDKLLFGRWRMYYTN